MYIIITRDIFLLNFDFKYLNYTKVIEGYFLKCGS